MGVLDISELAYGQNLPSLVQLTTLYGLELSEAFVKLHIGSLSDYADKGILKDSVIQDMAGMFVQEFYFLNVAEVALFVTRFKSGRYGELYGKIDPIRIMSAARKFIIERAEDISRKERKEQQAQQVKEAEEFRREFGDTDTRALYHTLLRRALAGDLQAQNDLRLTDEQLEQLRQ